MKIAKYKTPEITDVKIVFPFKEYIDIKQIIKAAKPNEISIMLEVNKVKEGNTITYKLGNYYIPKQTMSGANCEMDAEAEAEQLYKRYQAGLDIDKVRCMMHSHVNMSVFFSGTDQKTFDQQVANCNDFMLSIVTNLKEEFYSKIVDKEEDLYVENANIAIAYDDSFMSEAEAKELIKEATITPKFFTNGTYNGNVFTKNNDQEWIRQHRMIAENIPIVKSRKELITSIHNNIEEIVKYGEVSIAQSYPLETLTTEDLKLLLEDTEDELKEIKDELYEEMYSEDAIWSR